MNNGHVATQGFLHDARLRQPDGFEIKRKSFDAIAVIDSRQPFCYEVVDRFDGQVVLIRQPRPRAHCTFCLRAMAQFASYKGEPENLPAAPPDK